MPKVPASLLYKLESSGYLSLNQFVEYLKHYHPEASVSYPTAVKLVKEGKVRAKRVGSAWRVPKKEVERWVSEGNYEIKTFDPYPKI